MYYHLFFGSGLLSSFIILHTGGLLGCTLPGQQGAEVQSKKRNNLALPVSCLYLHSFLSPVSDPLPFISHSGSLFFHLSHGTTAVSLSCCLLAVGRSPRTRLISWLAGNSKTNKPKSLFKNCVNKRIFWVLFLKFWEIEKTNSLWIKVFHLDRWNTIIMDPHVVFHTEFHHLFFNKSEGNFAINKQICTALYR